MDLHVESFAIAPLIDDVVQTIDTMAAKNGNKVVVDCAADIGTMRADQTRIRQALLNLASNANKFTERGTVTIAARRATEAGPRVGDDGGDRHRHRHDARADGQAVPGVRPGRRLDHAQIRRHRARARDQPALLPDDGRRHHGGERAGPRLDLHHPRCRPKSAARSPLPRSGTPRQPRTSAAASGAADDPGGGRRSDRARGDRALSHARRLCGGDGKRRPRRRCASRASCIPPRSRST